VGTVEDEAAHIRSDRIVDLRWHPVCHHLYLPRDPWLAAVKSGPDTERTPKLKSSDYSEQAAIAAQAAQHRRNVTACDELLRRLKVEAERKKSNG
jgi:hypothetical protein